MVSRYEKSFVGMFDTVDEIIRKTDNAHHRAILLNYRRHGLLEVSQRWPELVNAEMMVNEPRYFMNMAGVSFVLDGREQVTAFYQSLEDTASIVMWPTDQVLAVADWGFASEATFLHFVPGQKLAADGVDVDDPEATYLLKRRYAFVWHYDENAKLIGEHVYEAGMPEIVKPDQADVITPADARRLLAPLIDNPPA